MHQINVCKEKAHNCIITFRFVPSWICLYHTLMTYKKTLDTFIPVI